MGEGVGGQSTYWTSAGDPYRCCCGWPGGRHHVSAGRGEDENSDSSESDRRRIVSRAYDANIGENNQESNCGIRSTCLRIYSVLPSNSSHLHFIALYHRQQAWSGNIRHLLRHHWTSTDLSDGRDIGLVPGHRTSVCLDQCSEHDHAGVVSNLTPPTRGASSCLECTMTRDFQHFFQQREKGERYHDRQIDFSPLCVYIFPSRLPS